jgi:hypothetical protein
MRSRAKMAVNESDENDQTRALEKFLPGYMVVTPRYHSCLLTTN